MGDGGKPPTDLRQRQMTCAISDLSKDMKQMLGNPSSSNRPPRATVKMIMNQVRIKSILLPVIG